MIERKVIAAMLTTSLLGLAATAHAQPPQSDAMYCASLIATYQKYIVETRDPDTKAPMRADLDTAVARCQAGDTAAGIPPLEKALRDGRGGAKIVVRRVVQPQPQRRGAGHEIGGTRNRGA
jgi:hypothetical protein